LISRSNSGVAVANDKEKDRLTRRNLTVDKSYRQILGQEAWDRLGPEVKKRFSMKPLRGSAIRYEGMMRIIDLSVTGWLFAQACRLIGTPLAPWRGTQVPMSIELVPDEKRRGVAWQRCYQFTPTKSFTVRSTKCKGGQGEFIEHIGRGFSMRLRLTEEDGNLVFTSVAYEIETGGRTFRIPPLLTPGITTVTHEQLTGDHFRFTLSVDHPLLGRTIYQDGEFYSAVKDR
jgi:hypothetical protein